MEIKILSLSKDCEDLTDEIIEILAQSQAHSASSPSMSCSFMMTFSAVPWQPELKKESEKVGSLL